MLNQTAIVLLQQHRHDRIRRRRHDRSGRHHDLLHRLVGWSMEVMIDRKVMQLEESSKQKTMSATRDEM